MTQAATQARFSEAAALAMEGELDEALAIYRALRAEAPLQAQVGEGSIHYRQEAYAEAHLCFQAAHELAPKDPAIAVLAALTRTHVGRPGEALALADEIISQHADVGMAHVARGQALLRLERPAEAELAYERAIEMLPGLPQGHLGLGLVKAQQGKIQEAIEALFAATEADPTMPQAYRALGSLFLGMGAYTIGIDLLEELGVLLTHDPEVVYVLCQLYAKAGRRNDLIQSIELLEAMVEPDPSTDVALSSLWLAADEAERSRTRAERSLAASPKGELAAEAHYHRGLALAALGENQAAEGAYSDALSLDPRHWQAANNRAAVLLTVVDESGEPLAPSEESLAQAAKCLEQARSVVGMHPDVLFNRALLLHHQGHDEPARATLHALSSSSPSPLIRRRAQVLLRTLGFDQN